MFKRLILGAVVLFVTFAVTLIEDPVPSRVNASAEPTDEDFGATDDVEQAKRVEAWLAARGQNTQSLLARRRLSCADVEEAGIYNIGVGTANTNPFNPVPSLLADCIIFPPNTYPDQCLLECYEYRDDCVAATGGSGMCHLWFEQCKEHCLRGYDCIP